MTVRLVAVAGLAAISAATTPVAQAQAATTFVIAAQPLEQALADWSMRTGMQVVMAGEVAPVRSHAVRGRLSAQAALRRLLDGTGYAAQFHGAHTVVLRRRPMATGRAKPPPSSSSGDVVVTGSRLDMLARNAIMPVQVMERGAIDRDGQGDLAGAMLRIGAIQPGLGLQSSQNQTSGGAGLSLIDLRGLGAARTLVLVDGQRQVGARRGLSAIDLNTIPPQMVERVEVSTGGASAIYGADAVAGVVNIILRRSPVDGIEVRATSAIAGTGDAGTRGMSVRWARSGLAGTGWRVVAGVYHDAIDAVDASARAYASDGLDVIQSAQGSTLRTQTGIRFGPADMAGSYVVGDTRYTFAADGTGARRYDPGVAPPRDGRQRGGDGFAPQQYDQLRIGLVRTIGDVSLRRDDGAHHASLSLRAAATTTRSSWQPMIFTDDSAALALAIDNPFLPGATAEAMRGAGVDRIAVAKVLGAFGRVGSINRRVMVTTRAGLDGPVGDAWHYALDAGWGRSHDAITTVGVADIDRLRQSVDAVRDPATGKVVCREAAARVAGCVPLNIVGNSAGDTAALAWSRIAPAARETLTQAVVGGHVTGHPLTIPGGPVEAMIGVEARRETSDRRSSAIQERGGTYLPQVPSFAGRYWVGEVLGEASAPVLRDRPGVERLTLTGAWRLSRYSTVGTTTAWHAGFDYAPAAGWRLRATRSRAVRAPNIGELHSGAAQGYAFVVDPCDRAWRTAVAGRADRCAALGLPATLDALNGAAKPVIYAGNAALRPEYADTHTVGVTWEGKGARVTLDGWRIHVDHAIGFPVEQSLLDDCVDAASVARRRIACAAVARDPVSGRITALRTAFTNIGQIDTAGIDMAARWHADMANIGATVDLSAAATWVGRLAVTADTATPQVTRQDGVLPDPRWRATFGARWSGGRVAVDWQARVIGSARITADDTMAIDLPTTGMRHYHDVGIALRLATATLRLDIINLFAATPPRRGFKVSQGIGAAALYPNLGRIVGLSATAGF